MKPMGPIPPAFAAQNGMLHIGGESAAALAECHGTPLFAYDFALVAAQVARLRRALPGIAIHYAMKANPLPALIGAIAPLIDGIDVASAGELALAMQTAPATPASFAGPGKRDGEIEAAIRARATINLESAGEAERALAIADRLGIVPRLAVRINPDFELRGSGMRMGGRASPFGIDSDAVPALVARLLAAGADWRGFHLFAGSQSLDSAAIGEALASGVALCARLGEAVGAAPPAVTLGGGFGVPYFAGDTPVDMEQVGAALDEAVGAHPGPAYAVELGRWLVAEAGVYLTRIVDRKMSRGETFLVTDGGLHHQLAASGNFGTVVRRNYPLALAGRMGAGAEETVSVVGCLCTPLDRLGDQVALPQAAPGDLVAIFLAGAYGASASPARFLGHPPAAEIMLGVTRHS